MRQIAFDTETTGLDPATGHRIVEVGCVEMINYIRTGRTFQSYLNPERDVPQEAFNVHGLSTSFLAAHPLFSQVAEKLLAFIGEDELVIHNAQFDMKFLNFELEKLGREPIPFARAIDTVGIARRRFPGAPAKLDALCKRFNIDTTARTKHGALLDAELLADVYLELMGGRQKALLLDTSASDAPASTQAAHNQKKTIPHRFFAPTADELAAHAAFLTGIKKPLWAE